MVKTINFKFDDVVVFELKITGSKEIVTKLVGDTWFNSALRNAAETLIKHNVEKITAKPPLTEKSGDEDG